VGLQEATINVLDDQLVYDGITVLSGVSKLYPAYPQPPVTPSEINQIILTSNNPITRTASGPNDRDDLERRYGRCSWAFSGTLLNEI